jgi:Tol biopolymer transport system component
LTSGEIGPTYRLSIDVRAHVRPLARVLSFLVLVAGCGGDGGSSETTTSSALTTTTIIESTATEPTTTLSEPTTVARNGLIAFVVPGLDPTEDAIWIVAPDGSDLRPLTTGQQPSYSPTWSPDGAQLAFVRADTEVVVIDPSTGDEQFVASIPGVGEGLFPTLQWSPDGTMIMTVVADTFATHIVDIASGAWIDVVDRTSGPPHWSPDGRWLLVPTPDAAYLVPNDMLRKGDLEGLASVPAVDALPPIQHFSWSPDSSAIAVASPAPITTAGGQIRIVNIPNSEVDELHRDRYPAIWSPDGDHIAYLRQALRPELGTEVWVIRADGTDDHVVGTSSFITPTWSPNGTRLVMLDQDGLRTVNIDGTNEIRVTPPTIAPKTNYTGDYLKGLEFLYHQSGALGDFAPSWQHLPQDCRSSPRGEPSGARAQTSSAAINNMQRTNDAVNTPS